MKRRDRSSAGKYVGLVRLGTKHIEMLAPLQGHENSHWSEAPTIGESAMYLIKPTYRRLEVTSGAEAAGLCISLTLCRCIDIGGASEHLTSTPTQRTICRIGSALKGAEISNWAKIDTCWTGVLRKHPITHFSRAKFGGRKRTMLQGPRRKQRHCTVSRW